MVKFSLIKIISMWIICINFLIVETLNDIEYGVKFSEKDNRTVNENINEKNTLRSSSSSSLIDERSNLSSNLKIDENLVSNGGIDRSKKGRFTLTDIEGPSISQDFESLTDSAVHVRVKRDNNFVRNQDEKIVDDYSTEKEIFSLNNEEEIILNDIKLPSKKSSPALSMRRKIFERDNFPTTKLLIPIKIGKLSKRIVRGGRKKNRRKYRKHKHRKKSKNGRYNKEPLKLSTRDDFKTIKNLKEFQKSSALLVVGKPEIEKIDIAEYRNGNEGENIFRVKRDKDVLEKNSIDTNKMDSNDRKGKFCRKDGMKVDDLNYYDDVRKRKRVKRRKIVNEGMKSFNNKIKIGEKFVAKKSLNDIKNLLGKLNGKVDELQGFYVGEKNDERVVREKKERFKRGKKPSTRCVDNDSKNLTKSLSCPDKIVGFKSKLKDTVEDEKSNKSREEKNISNDEKKINNYDKISIENNRRKRKSRKKWDRWTDWSSCSVTCGKGRQIRWRHCVHDCTLAETEMEEKTCQLPACGPGKFLGIF